MDTHEIIRALRCSMVETGSLLCMCCWHEHNCTTQGCAIMREAADALESQSAQISSAGNLLEQDAEIVDNKLKQWNCILARASTEADTRRADAVITAYKECLKLIDSVGQVYAENRKSRTTLPDPPTNGKEA